MAKVRYYSRVRGAMLYVGNGTTLQFMGDPAAIELDTVEDVDACKALNAMVKQPNSNIYTTATISPDLADAVNLVEEDIKKAAIAATATK